MQGREGSASEPEQPERAQVVEEVAEPEKEDGEKLLEKLGATRGLVVSDEALDAACESLVARGREARAIDLLRRAHATRASWSQGAWALARLLLRRGDDREADELLTGLERDRKLGNEAILARAEIAERAGDELVALTRYERVLAADLGNTRARSRAERLRRSALEPRGVGATLLAGDGALARGRYRIVRELGRGGAGTVFAADDVQTTRSVALKIYHSVRSRPERERLLSEARVAASLEHPGVVRILDCDDALGSIAMELLSRGSVKSLLNDRLAALDVLAVARSFADALAFVHAAGVVHRDLKPSNLLMRDDGRVVLTDFGVARRVGEVPPEPEGTLAYMAPEQREAKPVSARADVFSMGRILIELADCVREPDASVSRMRDVALRLSAASADERPASALEVVPLVQRC